MIILGSIPSILRELSGARALYVAALLVLPFAGVLVGLDVAARYGEVTEAHLPYQFFLSQDHGFGEYLEYAMMAGIAVLLLRLWRIDGSPIYLVNALLFAGLTADNAFEVHEKFGFWVAPWMPQGLPIEPHHIGEPLVFVILGGVWLVGLAASLRASRSRPVIYSLLIAGCIAGTAVFGIIVDEIVVYGPHTPMMTQIEAFIEDGGEFAMIIVSFLLTVAVFDVERSRLAAMSRGERVPDERASLPGQSLAPLVSPKPS